MVVVLPESGNDVPAALDVVRGGDPMSFGGSGRARRRERALPVVQLVLDLVAVSVAMVLAFRAISWLPVGDPAGASIHHLYVGLLSLPIWSVVLWRGRLFSEPHIAGRLDEFRRLAQADLASLGVAVIAAFLLRLYVSRGWLIVSGFLALAFLVGEREAVRRHVRRLRRNGRLLRRVVLVGANVEGLTLGDMLAADPELGYEPVGFVDDDAEPDSLLGGIPVLGPLSETYQAAVTARADAVIIATTAVDHQTTNRLIRQLSVNGFRVELSCSLCDVAPARLQLRPLGRVPVVYVDRVRRDGWEMRAKRAFDVSVALLLGVLAAPFLAAVAMAIKLTSRGPVHFRQTRVGKDGELFNVLKFRTMVVGAEAMKASLEEHNQADGPLFKLRSDPRITPVGRVLRALSIDELPQLWNVLRGDMSLVGPRPALPNEMPLWSPELHGRLAVKPGMTGMWQVSGGTRWHSFDEYARLDLYYVDNWSIWTDLAILAKTIPAVLFHRIEAGRAGPAPPVLEPAMPPADLVPELG